MRSIRNSARVKIAFIVVLACAGAWLSDQLLALHDRIVGSGQAGKSLVLQWCSAVSTGGGCETYAASSWSEFHLPIIHIALPVALLGWIYFAAIGLWYLTGGTVGSSAGESAVGSGYRVSRWRRWATIGVGVAGLYGSLFFLCIMAFTPAPWCIACLAAHLINFLMLAVIALDVLGNHSGVEKNSNRWSPVVTVAVLVVLVGLLNRGRSAASRARSLEIDLKPYQQMVDDARKHTNVLLAYYQSQPLVGIPPGLLMPPPYRHRLVVFTDLQCPACAANATDIDRKIKPLFGNALTVEVRQFPLCTACNPFAASNVHPDACEAALVAEAARQIGGESAFDAMVSALHSHYTELSPAIYDAEATRLHLPLDELHDQMTNLRVRGLVEMDIELGHSLGVVSTPTLFLDGRRVPAMCMTDDFWKAVATASKNAITTTSTTTSTIGPCTSPTTR